MFLLNATASFSCTEIQAGRQPLLSVPATVLRLPWVGP
jgi:hypothetical protein